MNQPFSSVWTREPRPARSATLSRTQIVRAAIELLDTEGLDALSMRRLGAKLGSGATSIYWHVANKDDLLELALDEVYGELTLPDEDAAWREAVSAFAHSVRAVLLNHPWAAVLLGSRPSLGPNAVALVARLMKLFQRAGFQGMAVDYAWSTLLAFVLGATTPEIAWRAALGATRMSGPELMETTHSVAERAVRDHPDLAAHYARYRDTDIEASRALAFDFGLTCLLDGLHARLDRGDAHPPGPDAAGRAGAASPCEHPGSPA
ncbi:TetR/AcrR family transcriptional regulator C-terminal domain-containing protein [Streptosporangium sp. NPDC004379]|uniref:TetR/AcrR family transcriptional regulator C-terminal domain-containing protein n=1 Tax=Streptosporangium sp. NPDC004379 TaxID=3366189 RepID=UPI0036A34CF0